MQVVFAPDKFAGTLSAGEAATAMATGWARQAPGDVLVTAPMSDGGPGFLAVLHEALGGQRHALTVAGPYGDPVSASFLRAGDTAYVESALVVGLHLTDPPHRDPERATSKGLGELLAQVLVSGAKRVVVGLGGSGTNDGGAGILAALGATCEGGRLDGGPAGLAPLSSVDAESAKARFEGVQLVLASDVDNPLLGLTGATKTYGPQKGLPDERLVTVDGWLQHFAELTDRKLAARKGAGAAGGLGFALMLLGGTRRSGVALVADAVGLPDLIRGADLVVTGEGSFDVSSGSGKVPYGVAEVAAQQLVPCIALAGEVQVGSREMRALGLESAYSLVDLVGRDRALDAPAEALAELSARTARTWSR